MLYRKSSPADSGFETEEEEIDAIRGYVQGVMSHSGADAICDTLLILANICENRALLEYPERQKLRDWYTITGLLIRNLLSLHTHDRNGPLPNLRLEDQFLYFPDVHSAQ